MTTDSNPSESTHQEQVYEIETDILENAFKAYPNTLMMPTHPDAVSPTDNRPLVRLLKENPESYGQALSNLQREHFVTTDHAMMHVAIRVEPKGIRELMRRRYGMATLTDVEKMHQAAMEAIAKIAEFTKAAEDAAKEENAKLATTVKGFDDRLTHFERDFYSRVFPIFALFIAAFALIISGTQGVVRIAATTPLDVLLLSGAMMLPIAVLVVILVLIAWLITRR